MGDQGVNQPQLGEPDTPLFDTTESSELPITMVALRNSYADDVDVESDAEDDPLINHTEVFKPMSTVSRTLPPYIVSLTSEERRRAEKALVRKIDIRLIPPIVIMYILNYIDRSAIASARLGGLEEDLGLGGSQYQTAVSILFVGYISMQVPSNLLMNKLERSSLYLPIAMMVWGMVSMCTGAVQRYRDLILVRFVLGFVESVFFPGALFLLSCFYTRRELSLRTALLYSGSLVSGTLSGLLAAAIMKMDGMLGLRAWRWLFIIEGTTTVIVAFACIFILPDMPSTTKWLAPEQRELASWRLDEDIGQNKQEVLKEQSFFYGLILAIKDTKVWIMTILLFCMVFSGSVTNFFPTVVETLGYGPIYSLLLTAPPYLVGVATCCINAWHSDRTGEKFLHVTLPLLVGIFSFLLAASTNAMVPRYIAMTFMIPGCFTGYVVALGWISAIIPRPPAKRAAALALINAISNTSAIFSAYLFPRSAAPGYKVAFIVCSCMSIIAVLTAMVLRKLLVRLNKKLDQGEFVRDVVGSGEAVLGSTNHRGFRFSV